MDRKVPFANGWVFLVGFEFDVWFLPQGDELPRPKALPEDRCEKHGPFWTFSFLGKDMKEQYRTN